jgi:hypothetical protein
MVKGEELFGCQWVSEEMDWKISKLIDLKYKGYKKYREI